MSLSYRTRLSGAAATFAAIATWVFAGGAAGAPSSVCQSASPQPLTVGSGANWLQAVSAVSARDVVAVGDYQTPSYQSRTLIERWNGSAWSVQPSPSPGSGSELNGVAATSARNAWAVGSDSAGALIEHWDGKTWRVQASPRLRARLLGVAATSARNAWAVGYVGSVGSWRAVIEHWDGQKWKVQRSPRVQLLASVAATSARNAWTVGTSGSRAVIEHWNGQSWTVALRVRLSESDSYPLGLSGVAIGSPTSVWAVGTTGSPYSHYFSSLIEHWNGRNWTKQRSPVLRRGLFAMSATSPSDAWAIGANGNASGPVVNVVAHWGGRKWTVQPSDAALDAPNLTGVSAKRGVGTWVVGSYSNATGRVQPLALRCPA